MNSMVNDLLGLARAQLGDGIPIERSACDLLDISRWAVDDASAAHPRARFELKATGDVTGSFDAARLQQLLTNLADNSAQYGTPEKPVHIELAGERERVVLTVGTRGR